MNTMMKNIILMWIGIIVLAGCYRVTRSSKETVKKISTPPPVWPTEKNFLREMAVGDSVFIIYRLSGWSNTAHLRNVSYYSFYAVQKIRCVGDKSYVSKRTFAYTPRNRFQEFEFDTMKYKLEDVLNLLSSFEYYCQDQFYSPSEEEKQKCEWHDDFKDRSVPAFENFIKEDLCSPKYNKWRFEQPSYQELKNWREKDQHEAIWKTEMLVFWNDTCKISYADRGEEFRLVYDY